MRPAPFPQRHIHAPGVHKVERDGEREGQAVVEKIMLEGGGTLSLREDGPRVHTEARRQNDGQGLYKVWLRGGGKGRLLLGTLVPEGGELVLSRTLSRRTLEDAGCWPVAGGKAVMAYPFTEKSAGEWYWEEVRPSAGAGGPELGAPAGTAGRGGGAAGRLLPRRRAVPAGPPLLLRDGGPDPGKGICDLSV